MQRNAFCVRREMKCNVPRNAEDSMSLGSQRVVHFCARTRTGWFSRSPSPSFFSFFPLYPTCWLAYQSWYIGYYLASIWRMPSQVLLFHCCCSIMAVVSVIAAIAKYCNIALRCDEVFLLRFISKFFVGLSARAHHSKSDWTLGAAAENGCGL